jgi:uncharacterized membrane protein
VTLLRLEFFYVLAGVVLMLVAGSVAWNPAHPKRWGSAAFWGLLGLVFLVGSVVPPEAVGGGVLLMVVLVVTGQVGREQRPLTPALSPDGGEGEKPKAVGRRLGNGLLIPPLILAVMAAAGSWLWPLVKWDGGQLILEKQANQISLGLACVVALAVAMWLTRSRPSEPLREGGRLLQDLGWALLLPPLLAGLGGIFTASGVGTVVTHAAESWLPTGNRYLAVVAYCVGMALFTVIMGNAFAAFPLMTVGIGIPFIVQKHGGDPAVMGCLGMLSGYCGTLITPMAANFNLVPAVLLEIPDKNAVIRAQTPMAAALFVFNVVAMALLVYRG